MSVNISGVLKSIRDFMRQDAGLNGDAQRLEQLGWMIFLKIFSDKDKELQFTSNGKYKSPLPEKYHWENIKKYADTEKAEDFLTFIDQGLFKDLKELDISTGNERVKLLKNVFEGNNNYMKSGTLLKKVIYKLDEINFNRAKDKHVFGDIYETMLKELQSAGKSGEFYTPRAITQFLTDIVDPKIGEKVLDPACGTGGFLSACVEKLKTLAKTTKERDSIQKNIMGIEFKPLPYMLAVTNMILHDVALPSIEERDSLDKPVTEYKEKDRVDIILANPPFGGVVTEGYEKNFPLNYRTKESADLFLVLFINLLKEGGRAAIVLPDGSLTGDGVKQRIRELWMTKCNLHTIIRLPNSVFQPYASVATNLLFFEKGTPTKDIWYYEHTLPEGQKSYSKTKPIQVNEFDPIKKWWNKRKESEVCWKVNIKEIEARGYDLDIKNPNKKEEEHEYTSKELISMLGESFSKSDKILKVIQKELKVG